MSGYRTNGIDFDDIFDPDVIGDGPTAGLSVNGVPIKYAHIQYGSKHADVIYTYAGSDVTNRWAAKGTAVYALPINNGQYTANSQTRGTARIRFALLADGTYQVRRTTGADATSVVVASGTWLPANDSVGNWTVAYEAVETAQTHQGDGTNSGVTNQATSAVGVSGNPYCDGYAVATFTGTNADSHGYLRIRLYRLGALRSTTTISYFCNVNGN
jgi:hypothetical protein